MATGQLSPILHYLRTMTSSGAVGDTADAELLARFARHRDEAAFTALVRRHGPMVLAVCRRVLRDRHTAEDAFQATFLVLARKAGSLTRPELLANWLHGVAYRTAVKARTEAARRRAHEQQAVVPQEIAPDDDFIWRDLRAVLDEEVNRLPARYRVPVVLCYLQGQTNAEAARRLGCSRGTVATLLARARDKLRRRLTQRGVGLSVGVALAALVENARGGAVARTLEHVTVKAATGFAAGSVPAHVVALTEGVVKAMLFSKLKNVVALGMIFLALTAGIGAWRYAAVAAQAKKPREEPSAAGEKLAPPVKNRRNGEEGTDEAKIPRIPAAKRLFRIDLSLTRKRKDGLCQTLGSPSQITSEGREACLSGMGDAYDISAGGGRSERILMGPSIRATIRSGEGNKVRLDMTVRQPTRGIFDQDATVESRSVRILRWVELGQPITVKLQIEGKDWNEVSVRAAIQEAEKESGRNTIDAAETDLKRAEFYRRTGHPDAARFYYELIRRRYPGTLYAERAAQRLDEAKPLARVGQIFIIGNKKTRDDVILKQISLFPGQILTYPDLHIAEKNLLSLKGLRSNPTVTVIDREGNAEFKDIQITVEEK